MLKVTLLIHVVEKKNTRGTRKNAIKLASFRWKFSANNTRETKKKHWVLRMRKQNVVKKQLDAKMIQIKHI